MHAQNSIAKRQLQGPNLVRYVTVDADNFLLFFIINFFQPIEKKFCLKIGSKIADGSEFFGNINKNLTIA